MAQLQLSEDRLKLKVADLEVSHTQVLEDSVSLAMLSGYPPTVGTRSSSSHDSAHVYHSSAPETSLSSVPAAAIEGSCSLERLIRLGRAGQLHLQPDSSEFDYGAMVSTCRCSTQWLDNGCLSVA